MYCLTKYAVETLQRGGIFALKEFLSDLKPSGKLQVHKQAGPCLVEVVARFGMKHNFPLERSYHTIVSIQSRPSINSKGVINMPLSRIAHNSSSRVTAHSDTLTRIHE